MFNDTIVTLRGRLGGDVTLRRAGEAPVAGFRLACTPRRFDRADAQWVDGETQWYSVSAWRQLGEHCARSLRRGEPVVVHGRLTQRTYTTKDGGEALDLAVEAFVVGHDLGAGTSAFTRTPRPATEEQASTPAA